MRSPTISFYCRAYYSCLALVAGVLCLLSSPSLVEAQKPTATIISLSGNVSVSVQDGSPTPGVVGMVLYENDLIKTRTGAKVIVEFSDKSVLELREKTAVVISGLSKDPQTGASRSHLDLWWGSMRTVLLSEQIATGSSLTVQTSNAQATVKSAKMESAESDFEVIYNPNIAKTTVIAHKFDVVITNLLTRKALLIPQGSGGIVHQYNIEKIATTTHFPEEDDSLSEITKAQEDETYIDRTTENHKQTPIQTINAESKKANEQFEQRPAEDVSQLKETLPKLDKMAKDAEKIKSNAQIAALSRVVDDLKQVVGIVYSDQKGLYKIFESDVFFDKGKYELSDRRKVFLKQFGEELISTTKGYMNQYPGRPITVAVRTIGYADELGFRKGTNLIKELVEGVEHKFPQREYNQKEFLNQRLSEFRSKTINKYFKELFLQTAQGNSLVHIYQQIVGRGENLPPEISPPYPTRDPRRRTCKIYVIIRFGDLFGYK